MKINAALAIAIITVASVRADVVVTDVTAAQRYPWNRLVDISCNVTGIEGETSDREFVVAAVNPETGSVRYVKNFWVVKGGTK